MKIIAVNKDVPGYPNEMGYNNPEFNGHQIGIAVFVINNVTGKIDDNLTKLSLDEVNDMLNNESIIFIHESITQVDNGELVPKTIYYLPYYVDGHSLARPSVNNVNTDTDRGYTCYSEIELLFVHEGLNRYLTVNLASKGIPLIDLVDDAFTSGRDNEAFLNSMGISYVECCEDDEEESGYVLDFYNEAGGRTEFTFSRLELLRNCLVSIRLIKCDHIKDGDN